MIKSDHFKQRETERGCKFKIKRVQQTIPLTKIDLRKKEAGLQYNKMLITDTCNAIAYGKTLITVYPRKDVD
jgi:hypothetical protein